MVGFYDARQLFSLNSNAQHKRFQLVQVFVAVGEAPRSDAPGTVEKPLRFA